MNEKLYGLFVDEGNGEKLVWESFGPNATERRFFFGGSSIKALVFTTPNSAHAFIRNSGVLNDFADDAQYYVRKVMLVPYAD